MSVRALGTLVGGSGGDGVQQLSGSPQAVLLNEGGDAASMPTLCQVLAVRLLVAAYIRTL